MSAEKTPKKPNSWLIIAISTILILGSLAILQFVFLPKRWLDLFSNETFARSGQYMFLAVCLLLILTFLLIIYKYFRATASKTTLLLITALLVIAVFWTKNISSELFSTVDELMQLQKTEDSRPVEDSVYDLLSEIHHAAEQFLATGQKDLNQNQIGEYGSLDELHKAGFLPKTLSPVPGEAIFIAHHYAFYLYLPKDPSLAEKKWCLYTWPLDDDESGEVSFFIHETADIYYYGGTQYKGSRLDDGPLACAAYFRGFKDGEAHDIVAMEATAFQDEIASGDWILTNATEE